MHGLLEWFDFFFNSKNIFFYRRFFWEQTFPIDSRIISYSSTTFWLINQLNAMMYVYGKGILFTYNNNNNNNNNNKSCGELRKPTVIQTPVKNHQ